ncbi:MAG: hypothetical protein ACKVP0_15205, partial [Pirellulaceae bacterium]
TDLSQRCVIIKLSRPRFDPTWEETTRSYIREHRQEIVGDLIAALRAERTQLARYSRWGAWERDILARLPEPADAQEIIAERQYVSDVEVEEGQIIEDAFRRRLFTLGYDPNAERIFIPSTVVAMWFSQILNDRTTTTAASRRLGQMIDEGSMKCIAKAPGRTHGRGFYWSSGECLPDSPVLADIEHRLSQQGRREHFQDVEDA